MAPRDEPESDSSLAELVGRALAKDRQAIRALCAALAPSVLATARAILGARHDALEDVVQETLLATIRKLGTLDEPAGVRYFAKKVAANRALETLRGERRSSKKAENYRQDRGPSVADGPDPTHAYEANELRTALRRVLSELSPIASEVLVLHYVMGHSLPEIALALGKPENTVRGRLQAAKAALRGRLGTEPALAEWLKPSARSRRGDEGEEGRSAAAERGSDTIDEGATDANVKRGDA